MLRNRRRPKDLSTIMPAIKAIFNILCSKNMLAKDIRKFYSSKLALPVIFVTALAATYATGTIRVLYKPWAKATLCHLTTHYVYSSPFPLSPSSSFLSFRSSQIAQSYKFRRRPLLLVKCILAYLVSSSHYLKLSFTPLKKASYNIPYAYSLLISYKRNALIS